MRAVTRAPVPPFTVVAESYDPCRRIRSGCPERTEGTAEPPWASPPLARHTCRRRDNAPAPVRRRLEPDGPRICRRCTTCSSASPCRAWRSPPGTASSPGWDSKASTTRVDGCSPDASCGSRGANRSRCRADWSPPTGPDSSRWCTRPPTPDPIRRLGWRCLHWLRQAAGDDGILSEPGPSGVPRAETRAHAYAHRAALLGADLLEAYGRPGADAWREWASELRHRFREDFWMDDRAGGRPAAGRLPDGRPVPHLGGGAAHLLDTGLLGGGRYAPGLLNRVQTGQLARLLGGPALDSGWGVRSLGAKEPEHNPFGHRAGAVRVHDTVVAVAGLAAAGYEKEAASHVGSSTQPRPSGTGCPRCTRGSSPRRKAFRCRTRPPAARRPWPRPPGFSF
jgi:hypothetical protein